MAVPWSVWVLYHSIHSTMFPGPSDPFATTLVAPFACLTLPADYERRGVRRESGLRSQAPCYCYPAGSMLCVDPQAEAPGTAGTACTALHRLGLVVWFWWVLSPASSETLKGENMIEHLLNGSSFEQMSCFLFLPTHELLLDLILVPIKGWILTYGLPK